MLFISLFVAVCVSVCVCIVERGRKRKEVLGENFLLFFLPPFLLNRMRQNNFVMKRREKGKKKDIFLSVMCIIYTFAFSPFLPSPGFFYFFLVG